MASLMTITRGESAHTGSRLLQTDDLRNRQGEPFPIGGLLFQMPPADARERVEFGAAPQLARFPFSRDPAFLLQLVQCRVERSIADLENIARNLLQPLADGPTVE